MALGSIFGGLQMMAWYPITPSSSLAEAVISWMHPSYGCRGPSTMPSSKQRMTRDTGMIIGAGWAVLVR